MHQSVDVKMHNGDDLQYLAVDRVEQDKHSYTLYGEAGNVIAVLSKGDVRNLITR
jgi:hypothetical protein